MIKCIYLFIFFCKSNVIVDYGRLLRRLTCEAAGFNALACFNSRALWFWPQSRDKKGDFSFFSSYFSAAGSAPVLQWRQPRGLVDGKNMLGLFESEVILASTFSFQNSYHSQCSYRGLLSKDQTAS